MKVFAILAAAALALPTAATAQSYDKDRSLDTFERADFIAVLKELGSEVRESSEQRNIEIEFSNGFKADGLLMACEDSDSERECYGTSILATFTPPDGATDAGIQRAINEYNYNENFGRAYVEPNGTIALRTYIISDGGITMESYLRQIELWVASAEDFFGYLYGDE